MTPLIRFAVSYGTAAKTRYVHALALTKHEAVECAMRLVVTGEDIRDVREIGTHLCGRRGAHLSSECVGW